MVKVWEAATGRLLRVLRCHGQTVYCIAYSPDGRLLASGDGFPPWESVLHLRTPGIVKIWDAATGGERALLKGHAQNVMGVAFSPDGSRLATVSGSLLAVPQVASKPGELLIWDVQNRARSSAKSSAMTDRSRRSLTARTGRPSRHRAGTGLSSYGTRRPDRYERPWLATVTGSATSLSTRPGQGSRLPAQTGRYTSGTFIPAVCS